MQLYLIRYGEIGTKTQNIRRNFEDILIQNIERTFLKYGKEVIIERERGRIFAYTYKESSYLFSRIFGIVSYSQVSETSSKMEKMKEEASRMAHEMKGTFAVRARRVGTHDYTSPEVGEKVGEAVLNANPSLKVDLDNPDNEINIEIRGNKAYIFSGVKEGPGGLPLSSQGKVACYIKSKDDFLATWLVMKRGARAYAFSGKNDKWVSELDKWDPNLQLIGEGTKEEFFNQELPDYIEAIILGDTLNEISEKKHRLSVFYPIVGFDREMKERYMKKIQTLLNHKLLDL